VNTLEKVTIRLVRAIDAADPDRPLATLDTGEVLPAPIGTRAQARVAYFRGPSGRRLEKLWDVAPERIRDPVGTLLRPYSGPPELLDDPATLTRLQGRFLYATPAVGGPLSRREMGDGHTLVGHAIPDGRFLVAYVERNGRALTKRLSYGYCQDRRIKTVPIAWDKWRFDAARETPERLAGYARSVNNASGPALSVTGLRVRLEEDPGEFFDVYDLG
jgi:hypothetical protein